MNATTNLHSTIFILKPQEQTSFSIVVPYLHSTIFILKHSGARPSHAEWQFTFYYIYIKTGLGT